MRRPSLSTLKRQIREAAQYRQHRRLMWEALSADRARATCPRCGKWADADTNPAPNGIDVGGPLVALSCTD